MAEADLTPEVEVTMVPETTIIAGNAVTTPAVACCNKALDVHCLCAVNVNRLQKSLNKHKACGCFLTAGVKVAMVTGLQEDPTETAMTVTVSLGSNGNDAYVAVGTLFKSSDPVLKSGNTVRLSWTVPLFLFLPVRTNLSGFGRGCAI